MGEHTLKQLISTLETQINNELFTSTLTDIQYIAPYFIRHKPDFHKHTVDSKYDSKPQIYTNKLSDISI